MMSRRLLSASALVAACAMLAAQAYGKPKVVQVTVRVDSQAPGYEGSRAFDGNRGTMWHTRWEFGETKHPHEMTIDLGASFELAGFAYLPREGGGNGTIGKYEVYVGDNPKTTTPRSSASPSSRASSPSGTPRTSCSSPRRSRAATCASGRCRR